MKQYMSDLGDVVDYVDKLMQDSIKENRETG
jgi:hypothetical protein